jgi:hypothetical protein
MSFCIKHGTSFEGLECPSCLCFKFPKISSNTTGIKILTNERKTEMATNSMPDVKVINKEVGVRLSFEIELCNLINKFSVENIANVPDFILASMICRMIEAMGPKIKQTLTWHGCDSVCHPKPKSTELKT